MLRRGMRECHVEARESAMWRHERVPRGGTRVCGVPRGGTRVCSVVRIAPGRHHERCPASLRTCARTHDVSCLDAGGHTLTPPCGSLSCLHEAVSRASTWQSLMPPRGSLSCIHVAHSHALCTCAHEHGWPDYYPARLLCALI